MARDPINVHCIACGAEAGQECADDSFMPGAGHVHDEREHQARYMDEMDARGPICYCWNEGQFGRVHREDCLIHGSERETVNMAPGESLIKGGATMCLNEIKAPIMLTVAPECEVLFREDEIVVRLRDS